MFFIHGINFNLFNHTRNMTAWMLINLNYHFVIAIKKITHVDSYPIYYIENFDDKNRLEGAIKSNSFDNYDWVKQFQTYRNRMFKVLHYRRDDTLSGLSSEQSIIRHYSSIKDWFQFHKIGYSYFINSKNNAIWSQTIPLYILASTDEDAVAIKIGCPHVKPLDTDSMIKLYYPHEKAE